MKKLGNLIRLSGYLLLGGCCLVGIFFYLGAITIDPFTYKFEPSQLYFYLTLILLPFFRATHRSWFISKDEFVSTREQALQQHHADVANQYKGGKWSVGGARVNPYEYTSPYTMSYDSSLNWGYSVAKGIFMSILFILLAPVFYIVAWGVHKRNEGKR